MKKINRKVFEDLIRVERKYRRTGDVDVLDKKTMCSLRLERETGAHWTVFYDLSGVFGLLQTTDKKIEEIMNLLGFELVEEILTKTEKEYLSNIIKPFKKYISVIKKISIKSQEQIIIMYHDYLNTDGSSFILLPTFKQGTMYRGMELYKEYTLKELGL